MSDLVGLQAIDHRPLMHPEAAMLCGASGGGGKECMELLDHRSPCGDKTLVHQSVLTIASVSPSTGVVGSAADQERAEARMPRR